MTALAYVVSHGRIVLEGTPDWSKRVQGVVRRLTPSTCRRCGGEDFVHLPVNGALCRNWKRSLGSQSTTWWLHQKVADIVGRRPENIEALGHELKTSLGGAR